MFLCSPWCYTLPKKLTCMETICFVKQENSYLQQKVLSPRIERKWLGFTKCSVGFNWITEVQSQKKWNQGGFIISHGSGISSALVLNFELWCSSASLSPLRVNRCHPQLHLASDALELQWCSGMSMRCRHCVKKEAKRWVSTWDFSCALACHCVREKAVNENTWIFHDNSAGQTNSSNISFSPSHRY